MIFVAVSTGHFDPLIEKCMSLSYKYDFLAQIGSGLIVPDFRHFRTAPPDALVQHMREAEVVITHAGTGMLSMLYRLKKPAIIVPKQIRYGEMNDGQCELGVRWAELGMGLLCIDLKDLDHTIATFKEAKFEFPNFPSLGVRLFSQMVQKTPTLWGLLPQSEAGE